MSKSAFRQLAGLILLVTVVVVLLIAAGCAPQGAVGIAAAIVLIARDVCTPDSGGKGGPGDREGFDGDAS
ncbi:hypothetical protein HLK59_45465 [Streptomyces sp. S3(2020)]|uniref:hypothetical protein n=1 Tax=Streptomyces sp. S3(2020) TaxID=2732044 RepID=UPI001488ABE2|nr:hypothetical protein [Streptomyces sp. S3(2020)]NNN37459.1 hypothetical protein [Streptomyces sp. S3(2020)]